MFWRRVSIPEANTILDRLNGRHYLILGNHDEVAKRVAGRFEWVKETFLVQTPTRVWLSHYAHRSWPDSHKFSYHVYGHTHGVLPDYRYSTDVGVDAKNYRPFSYEELVAYMTAKGQLPPDEVQIDMYANPKLEEPHV
jgi:calcineurin-like phosphoesterase family protein